MIARKIGMYDMFFLIFFLIFALSFDEPLGRAVSKLGMCFVNTGSRILCTYPNHCG